MQALRFLVASARSFARTLRIAVRLAASVAAARRWEARLLRDFARIWAVSFEIAVKGDANRAPDAWKFVLKQPTQDKVAFSIPYAGYVFELLSVREFRTALIGLPALLMALWMVAGLWRDGGEEIRRRREGVKPWGPDVARRLPSLTPLAEAAVAAARSTVRLPVSWPQPKDGRRRPRRAAAGGGFVSPLVGPKRRSDEAGTVALPADCVARERRVTKRRRESMPAGWLRVVDPRL